MLTLLLSVLLLSLLLLLLLLLVKMESRGDIETLGKRRRSASALRRLVYRDEKDWGGRKKKHGNTCRLLHDVMHPLAMKLLIPERELLVLQPR